MKEGTKFAELNNIEFFETSAKENDGTINDMFSTLASQIRKTFKDEELSPSVWKLSNLIKLFVFNVLFIFIDDLRTIFSKSYNSTIFNNCFIKRYFIITSHYAPPRNLHILIILILLFLLNVYIQNILFAHSWKHTLLVVNSLAYRLIYFLNLRFRSK